MGFGYNIVNPEAVDNLVEVPEAGSDKPLWDAWWESENSLGSALAVANDGWLRDEAVDPDYDPSDDLIGTDYDTPEFHVRFSTARNQTELQRMMFHYNREQDNRDRIAEATLFENLPVAFATGLLDPMMAPFMAVPALRGPMLARAVKASALGMAEAATEELLLHPTQQTRTLGESFMNVGATGVLASVLGPLLSKSGADEIDGVVKHLDEELKAPPLADSIGAARYVGDESKLVGNRYLFKTARKLFPTLYNATAEGPTARSATAQLVEDNYLRVGHTQGVASGQSIETMVGMSRDTGSVTIIASIQDAFPAYRKAAKAAGQKVKIEDFDRVVAQAVEYGSDDTLVEAAAAPIRTMLEEWGGRAARQDMIPDMADDAIDEAQKSIRALQRKLERIESKIDGAWDEDRLATMKRSLAQKQRQRNQLYNESRNPDLVKQLDAEIAALRVVKKANKKPLHVLEKERDQLLGDIDAAKKAMPGKTGKARVPSAGGAKHYLPTVYKPLEISRRMDEWVRMGLDEAQKAGPLDADALQEVEKVMRNAAEDIMHNYHNAATYGPMKGIRFAKHRKFDISRETLRKHGFLEDNLGDLWSAYSRGMIPRIIMKEQGFDIGDVVRSINSEYDEMIIAAERAGKARRANFLRKEQRGVVDRIKGMEQMISGTWNLPNTPASTGRAVARGLMDYNIITKLGSVTISAIPDVGHIIGRVGLGRYAKAVSHLANASKAARLSRQQAGKWAAIYELNLANVAKSRALIDDTLPVHQQWLRASNKLTSQFIRWTGQNHWNQFQRTAHIMAYTDEMLEFAANGKWRTMSKSRRAMFAQNGIGDIEWEALEKMYKHVDEVHTATGILRVPNYEDWEDTAIAGKLRLILAKEAETGVVSPGAGDLPLISRTTAGKLWTQLKTFQFTAANKILIPSLQRMSMGGVASAKATSGFLSSMAFGAVVYGLKSAAYGKDISDDEGLIIKEAIDRSGYFGIFSDANTVMDKLSKGRFSATAWLSDEEMSRYYTRSVVGDILGPSLGTLDDARRVIGMISDVMAGEGANSGDLKALRRMIPYQNLIWIRNGLVNPAEEAIFKRIGE